MISAGSPPASWMMFKPKVGGLCVPLSGGAIFVTLSDAAAGKATAGLVTDKGSILST
jgi:hypothetical protein